MTQKKIYLYVITFLLAVLIITGLYVILYRTNNLSRKPDLVKETTSLNLKTKVPSSLGVNLPEREKVKPSRPEDLGIIVYYEDDKPKTQEEWNAFISESYQKNRGEFEGSYQGEFGPSPYEQLDNADLEEMDTNRVRIDEKISEYEAKLKNNPDDKDLKVKLENWQKFKALLIAVYGGKSNVEE